MIKLRIVQTNLSFCFASFLFFKSFLIALSITYQDYVIFRIVSICSTNVKTVLIHRLNNTNVVAAVEKLFVKKKEKIKLNIKSSLAQQLFKFHGRKQHFLRGITLLFFFVFFQPQHSIIKCSQLVCMTSDYTNTT